MTSPGPFRPQFDAAISAAGLQVTKENVLFFRDTIYNEARRLEADLTRHSHNAVNLPPLGSDPVSGDAATAFPAKIQQLLDQCKQYIDDLKGAAGALDDTARRYGLTEDDITTNFHHAAPSAPPVQPSDVERGRTAVPSQPAPPPSGDGPRERILAPGPGPGAITAALSPGAV